MEVENGGKHARLHRTVRPTGCGRKSGLFEWSYSVDRPSEPSIDYLIAEAHHILDRAFREHHAACMLPLYSGGNDSGCSAHVASLHPRFGGSVYTINTRTGAFKTKLHQRRVCQQFGWRQVVGRSRKTMEEFVRERGLPGPGRHQWIYQRLKDHVIKAWVQEHKSKARPVALITGCRSQESTRRLGHAEEIKRGQSVGDDGTVHGPYELWTAPIVHWSSTDKRRYMQHFQIPLNPFSSTMGMSLECCCGAFADRADFGGACDERELLRRYAPDVSRKIDMLERIARERGHHAVWGTRPPECASDAVPVNLPPLCQSCAARSA